MSAEETFFRQLNGMSDDDDTPVANTGGSIGTLAGATKANQSAVDFLNGPLSMRSSAPIKSWPSRANTNRTCLIRRASWPRASASSRA